MSKAKRKHGFNFSALLTEKAMNELVCQQFAFAHKIVADKENKVICLKPEYHTIHFTDTDVRVYLSVLRNAGNLPYFITSQHEIAHDLNLKIQPKGNSFGSSTVSKSLRRLAQTGFLYVVKTKANSRYYPLARVKESIAYLAEEAFAKLVLSNDKIYLFKRQHQWCKENAEEVARRKKKQQEWDERIQHFERYKNHGNDSMMDSFWQSMGSEIGDEDEDGDDFLPAEWDKFHD